MTLNSFRYRLWLYIACAVFGYMIGDMKSLHLSEVARDRAAFVLSSILAGAIVARAFIDKSPTEVGKSVDPSAVTINASEKTEVNISNGEVAKENP